MTPTETDHDPLSMLDHDGHVSTGTHEAGQVVDGDSQVVLPGAESTPQTLHLQTVLLPILQQDSHNQSQMVVTYCTLAVMYRRLCRTNFVPSREPHPIPCRTADEGRGQEAWPEECDMYGEVWFSSTSSMLASQETMYCRMLL